LALAGKGSARTESPFIVNQVFRDAKKLGCCNKAANNS